MDVHTGAVLTTMTHLFLIYMAVTLVTGGALVLVWRHDRNQAFSGWLGVSHLIWAFKPAMYMLWRQPEPLWHHTGTVGMMLVNTGYIMLVVLGFGHLSGRRFSRTQLVVAAVGLGFLSWLFGEVDPALAQAAMATMSTVVGLVLVYWLRRFSPIEQCCGVLLVLCGLAQYIYVFQGEAGLPLQTTVATVLRLLLGLAVLCAAFMRSTGEIRRVRDRFMDLVERSHQGVTVFRGMELVYANPAFRRIYGLPEGHGAPEVMSRSWIDATVPRAERVEAIRRSRRILAGEVPQLSWEGERVSLDGRRLQLRFSAWQVEWDGAPALQLVVTDDTARHDALHALWWQATHDELTGLPNRSALLQRLRTLFGDPETRGLALVLLDVDRFKMFNDAHGHATGDEVLKGLAAMLTGATQGRAEVMRLGEDEFALLAAGADGHALAEALTAQVREALSQPLMLPQHQFFLDVSMGVAVHPSVAEGPDGLLQAADAAMYRAKALPGISVQWAQGPSSRGMAALLTAEQALRTGIRQQEFALVYQPKVRAGDASLVGFEALVRWDRPGQGRISPLDFIPAAERTGLIVPLGALILDQACRQLAHWRAQGHAGVPVAVNVSPLQLLDSGFPLAVMNTLKAFDVPASLLTLEITESAAVTHMEQAREQIAQLRAQGVEVALDDFGTGFSSLNMLRSLPLHTVKIDRSLIDPMPAAEANAVVKAICDLALVLDLEVVAEGVETQAHAEAALAAGCDVLQGYFYARPLEVADATRWLQGQR